MGRECRFTNTNLNPKNKRTVVTMPQRLHESLRLSIYLKCLIRSDQVHLKMLQDQSIANLLNMCVSFACNHVSVKSHTALEGIIPEISRCTTKLSQLACPQSLIPLPWKWGSIPNHRKVSNSCSFKHPDNNNKICFLSIAEFSFKHNSFLAFCSWYPHFPSFSLLLSRQNKQHKSHSFCCRSNLICIEGAATPQHDFLVWQIALTVLTTTVQSTVGQVSCPWHLSWPSGVNLELINMLTLFKSL